MREMEGADRKDEMRMMSFLDNMKSSKMHKSQEMYVVFVDA